MTGPSWPSETVGSCLDRIRLPRVPGVKTRDYKASGRYPIVDQGQTLIAGWTDAEDGVISEPLPVIVFGDHSRTFKYVDFPFVRGADGTQILKPREGVHPLFFYFACQSLDLPRRGYNRHFSALKERSIPIPDPLEQARIASTLQQVDEYMRRQDKQLAVTQGLKQATAQRLFSHGLHSEAIAQTEIGATPESWTVESVEDRYDVASGTTPARGNAAFWEGGTIPWVKTAEVGYSVITATEEHVTQEAVDSGAARIFPENTLLLAMYGQGPTRGKVGMLGLPAACNQACAALTPKDERLTPRFLYHFLTWRYEAIRSLAHGGQQQNLNLDIVRALPVAYPSARLEQAAIVEVLDSIDERIAVIARKQLLGRRLMSELMHRLLSGEIRVGDLNLDALSMEAAAA